jgi:polyhydroxyalkanoate synthesis regulator phasin
MIDKGLIEKAATRALEEYSEHRTYICDVALTVSMKTGYTTSDVKKVLDELINESKFTYDECHVKMGLLEKPTNGDTRSQIEEKAKFHLGLYPNESDYITNVVLSVADMTGLSRRYIAEVIVNLVDKGKFKRLEDTKIGLIK